MLDFDGTLVEIAPTPASIVVPDDLSGLLRELADVGHRVWILSGRRRDDVLGQLGPGGAELAVIGLHGLDWPGARLERERVIARVRARLLAITERHPALELLGGHEVLELRPVARLCERYPDLHPLYIGDDTTDEEAFAALPAHATSVRVGPAEVATHARARAADPGQVRAGLRQLSRLRSSGAKC